MLARPFARVIAAVALMLAAPLAAADDRLEAELFVKKAETTIAHFAADPELGRFRTLLGGAKGVLIIPTSIKGGFIVGASGGHGAMLSQDTASGVWSYPAYYVLGSVTLGLQIGGEVSEIVMLVMTDRGMDALLGGTFKLGGDASIAAGPVGIGGKVQTADVLAWARSKGAYAGVNLEGAVVETKDSWNRGYYGRPVRPIEILVHRTAENPQAEPLRAAVAAIAEGR